MNQVNYLARQARTKIVATIGPACSSEDQIAELTTAGADVFRLNMAHGSQEEHAEVIGRIRRVSERLNTPLAILVDLAGPKIRLGNIPNGQMDCVEGAELTFVRGEANEPGQLTTTYAKLIDELEAGDKVMLADGTVSLAVVKVRPDHAICRVVQPGIIRSRQGVNLPGVKLSLPAMTKADVRNATWAAEQGVDFVSLSFVRSPEDVRALTTMLRANDSSASVIAKIEKPEALDHLEEIVAATDGVMIARGDLGVEIDIARVPIAQKRIMQVCNQLQKPVITATQMLDSMHHSRQPTRAEATDVANAILDGTDACMLSGETAIGEHPALAVEMMHRIALATEELFRDRPRQPVPTNNATGLHRVTPAVVYGAGMMAQELKARLVVVASHRGATALAISKQRNFVPTIGVSDQAETLRKMCLFWGVIPLSGVPTGDPAALLKHVEDWGCQNNALASGDCVVLVTGTELTMGGHNLLMVHEVE